MFLVSYDIIYNNLGADCSRNADRPRRREELAEVAEAVGVVIRARRGDNVIREAFLPSSIQFELRSRRVTEGVGRVNERLAPDDAPRVGKRSLKRRLRREAREAPRENATPLCSEHLGGDAFLGRLGEGDQ